VEDCLYLFGVWILRSALLRSTTLNPVDHLEHLISKVNWVNFEINLVLPSLLLVFVEKVLTCLFTPPLGNFQFLLPMHMHRTAGLEPIHAKYKIITIKWKDLESRGKTVAVD
jgi:hypothetical protein